MSAPTVVDADAHYWEPLRDFGEYVDEPWRSRIRDHANPLVPSSTGDRFVFGRIRREEINYPQEDMTPEEIPTVMQHVGVDKILLLPNKMLTFGDISGTERASILANAYVDYMLDRVVDPDEGIYTMVVVPFQDPVASVELIERVADEEAIPSACFITKGPEPPLGDRKYDPIYEACQDAGLPAVFHASGSSVDHFHVRGYEKFIETHTLGFLMNNMSQLVSLIIQGVPEKFPDLDIVFQESGLFWVPLLAHRLDTEYLKRQSEAPLLSKRPSEYMKDFYYGTQPLEQPENDEELRRVIDSIGGPEQVIYSSDYPHWDYDPPSTIQKLPCLTDEEKARVLGGTAEEIYSI
jgi:predicted TIM-barrel fold metal-dependent hydrolase